MIYGLYLSAQGADVQSMRQDVISTNLANAGTTGFKRDLAVFQAHRPYDEDQGNYSDVPGNLNQSTGGITLADIVTDFRSGAMLPTGGEYDVALNGPGFLKVSDGQTEYLTRNGRLARDVDGTLVATGSGFPVLSVSGSTIQIPDGTGQIEISSDGTIYRVGSGTARQALGQLAVVNSPSPDTLEKLGNSLYRANGDERVANGSVPLKHGFLEASGTEPVSEMVQLIEASRSFEANINMIRTQDETLGRLLQAIPRR